MVKDAAHVNARLLIKGGCVLTLGPKSQNFPQADVLIEDGRIAEIGRDVRARGAEVVDAADTIVMPGFVDVHRHLWKTLLRNLGTTHVPGVDAGALEPDDVYAATLLGILAAAETGVTTIVDWADAAIDDDRKEAALQAHDESGLRTVFVRPGQPKDERGFGGSSDTHLRTVAYGSPDLFEADVSALTERWTRARRDGLRIHAHAATRDSATTTIRDLAAAGMLAADVSLVHCFRFDDEDLDAIASSRASVLLTPAAEMAHGLGPPPVQQFIDRGIRPGLGVGDELLAPGDLFSQMRAVQSIQHAMHFDLKLAGKGGLPNLLDTRDTIRYATLDGARAIGLAEVTGSLEPGKQADIVLLRMDRPNIAPVNDPIGAVVWGMDPSNVEAVYVAGRPIVRAGVLEADVDRVRRLAIDASAKVLGTKDRLVDAGSGGGP